MSVTSSKTFADVSYRGLLFTGVSVSETDSDLIGVNSFTGAYSPGGTATFGGFSYSAATSGKVVSWDGMRWANVPSAGAKAANASQTLVFTYNLSAVPGAQIWGLDGLSIADHLAGSGALSATEVLKDSGGNVITTINWNGTSSVGKLLTQGYSSVSVQLTVNSSVGASGGSATFSVLEQGFVSAGVSIDKEISLDGTNWVDIGNGNLAQDPTVLVGTTLYERVIITNLGNLAIANGSVSDQLLPNFKFGGQSTFSLAGTYGATVASDAVAVVALSDVLDTATVNGTANNGAASIVLTANDTVGYSVFQQADRSVTKDDGKTVATPGTPDSYTIVVTNGGPSTISSFNLVDTLPAALQSVSFTPSTGSYSQATGVWSGLSLASGQSVTLTVAGTISPTATGSLVNSVTISSPADTNTANNTATDTDTLTPVADLSVTKDDGKTVATPGTPDSYTIVVTNGGPSTISSFNLVDTLPAALQSVSFTPSTGSYSQATGVWSGLSLASGQSVTLTVAGTIDPTATGSLVNSVTISSPADTNTANNTATDTDTLTPVADLSVTKDDGKTVATPGTPDSYTIVVTNGGPSTISSFNLVDTLPAALQSVSFTPSTGSYSQATGVWSGLSLASGQSVTLTVAGTISPTATGSLVNSVTISSPADTNTANNTATDTDTLTPVADLSVTKDDGKTVATPGTPDSYTIVVTNGGPSTISSFNLVDTLPAALQSVSFTPSTGSYSQATGVWSGLSLASGQSVTLTVAGTISPTATGSLVNSVTISSPADTNTANNTATDTDTLTPVADLSVTKDDGKTVATPGTPDSYTIVVTNGGPSTISSFNLVDTLPAALQSVSFTPSTGSYSQATGVWSGLSLASGQSVTLTVAGTISPTATGSLVNSVTISSPADTNTANNTATDTDTLTPVADLSVTKDDGKTVATPGTPDSYTIVVTNGGPSTISSFNLVDTLPAALQSVSFTPSTGSYSQATGVWSGLSLASGQSVTLTVAGTISPTATGSLVNSVTISSPADTNTANNTATDTDTLTPVADLSVTKDDGKTVATPGTPDSYTIVVTNGGPSTISSFNLVDTLPAALQSVSFTPSTGSYSQATGVWSGLSLASGQSVTLTVAGTISPTATGSLVNSVTISSPADTNTANNTATDTDTLTPVADLSVTKDDGKTVATPGTPDSYTIVVTNGGPSTISSFNLVDTLPAALQSVSFTPSTGSYSQATGVWSGLSLASGQSVTLTVAGTISPTATGSLVNSVTISSPADTNTANNTATDTDTLTPVADLSVTKDDGKTVATPGTPDSYTIVVTNGGPSTISSFNLVDTLPAALQSVSFTPSTGSYSQATGVWSGLSLASGQSVTLTVAGTISPTATGSLVNSVTISSPADTNTANNTATDTDTLTPVADLSVTKDDGKTVATPGTPDSYTIVVTNGGPSTISSFNLVDTLPAALQSVSFTPSTGSYSQATGVWSGLSLASGQSVTLTVAGTISPTATGSLVNSVTISSPADTNTANNTATDTDTLTPVADLSVTKDDGKTVATPGTPDSYTIVVTNGGPSTISSFNLVDTLPAALQSVSFTPSTGSYSQATGVWSGLSLASGQSVTLTVAGTISPTATGSLVNSVTISSPADTNTANNTATDTDTLTPVADLSVTKTDGKDAATPGTPDSYTITVTNGGPSTITSFNMVDTVPTALLNATFGTPSAGAYNSGTGVWSGLSLASGQSVSITLSGTISPTATGSLVNSVTISSPADTNTANNTATDTDTLTPQVDLAITKTDNQTSVVAGLADTYTIVVTNNGVSTATGAKITDTVPLNGVTFTSVSTGGATGATASGSGNTINDTVTMPVGSTITYTVTGTVDPAATGSLTNTATVTAPNGTTDTNPSNNSATDTDTILPPPAVIVGNPQFNFPNSVTQIQPKSSGNDSFTLTPGGFIYWDFYSSDISKAQINTAAGSFSSAYANLKVSIAQVWSSTNSTTTGQGIYRVWVSNETANTGVTLNNSTDIVDYSIVDGTGAAAAAGDKGLIDLVNADPIIGNFNNFNNIENAVPKAADGFTKNPAVATSGVDKAWLSADVAGQSVNEAPKTFDAGGANDAVYGANNSNTAGDTLSGGAGNNLVDGRAGNDVVNLSGQTGNNYLFGGLGNDTLTGGSGNDILFGGYGVDTLTGGAGADVFILHRDDTAQITDFVSGTDKLWVELLTGPGTQPTSSQLFLGALGAAPASTKVVYDNTNGNVFYDPDGTGTGVAATLIGVLTTHPTLVASDFRI